MVDHEQTPGAPDEEGPRRRTYTPPDESAVFTGSFPVIDDEVLNQTVVASEPVAPEAPSRARAATDPPIRQSLTDAEIMVRFQGPEAGSTSDMILELERQVSLRQDEEEAFAMWANLVRATRGDDAEVIIARELIIFNGGEPEPEREPEPEAEPEPEPEAEAEAEATAVPEDDVLEESASAESHSPDDHWPLQQNGEEEVLDSSLAETLDEPVGAVESPEETKTGATSGLFWMWSVGITPALGVVAGAFLISRGSSFFDAVVAVLVGGVLAGLVVAAGARASTRNGVSTLAAASRTFGTRGTLVPSAVLVVIRSALVALALVGAVGLGNRVLQVSGLWPFEQWIALASLGVIVVGATLTLGILGGRVLRMALWISAGLGFVGLVGFVVLNLGPVVNLGVPLVLSQPLTLLGAIALVFSGLLVLFAHTGGDLSTVHSGSRGSAVPVMAAVGAIVPLALTVLVSALVASANPVLAPTLVTDPVGFLVVGLPVWYPAPVLLLFVAPLIGFAAFLLFTAGKATEVFAGPGRFRTGTAITGVLAVAAATAVVVFQVNVVAYFPDALIALGVMVAAWAGAYAVDHAVVKRSLDLPVRVAPLLGMAVALGIGFGLVSSNVSWLAWQGYLLPVLTQLGVIDLSPAAPGVFVALVVSAVVALIAGLWLERKEQLKTHD